MRLIMPVFDMNLQFTMIFSFFLTVATWKILDVFPNLLRKKHSIGDKLRKANVIGHRGSRNEGLPENTIAAFKDAVKSGADVIEFDVWLTKDEKVVVFHDDNFSRMGGGNRGIVSETKFNDMPFINPPIGQRERTSEWDISEWQRIPSLEQSLDAIPLSVPIIVEFKQDSPVLISEVLRIVTEKKRLGSMFWFSLSESLNAKLRTTEPRIPNIVSINGILRILLLHYTGLLPFVGIKENVFGITVEEVVI